MDIEKTLLQAQSSLIEILQNQNKELREKIEHLESLLFHLAKDGSNDIIQGNNQEHTD